MRFEQYLTEDMTQNVINWGKKMFFHWKSMWIVDTKHGAERLEQRNKLSDKQLAKLFRRAIEIAIEARFTIGDKVLFISNKLKQAFIGAMDRNGNMVLVTFYPRNAHPNPRKGEGVVLLEGKQIKVVELD